MRLKCIISYDGTHFSGYQVQPNKRTVQSELQEALSKLHKGHEVRVSGSGRTDAKVHAVGQVIHFDTTLTIPIDRWPVALNSLLPEDIVVTEAEVVDAQFHARFDATAKEYRYRITLSGPRDVFKRNYSLYFPYLLNKKAMTDASTYLLGTHDFTSFCAARTDVEDKVRTIYEIDVYEEGNDLIIRFLGNGFLYNMVRIMVGTLLDAGQGLLQPSDLKDIIVGQDRSLSGKTVPGHGLYLWKVYYDN